MRGKTANDSKLLSFRLKINFVWKDAFEVIFRGWTHLIRPVLAVLNVTKMQRCPMCFRYCDFIWVTIFQQAGSGRVFIMKAVDEEEEEGSFPMKYLQERQVLSRYCTHLYQDQVFAYTLCVACDGYTFVFWIQFFYFWYSKSALEFSFLPFMMSLKYVFCQPLLKNSEAHLGWRKFICECF